MDASIEEQRVPKLVIQQLAENSVNHGYANSGKVMEISVGGYREGDFWFIQLVDNGEGFSAAVLEKLNSEDGKA